MAIVYKRDDEDNETFLRRFRRAVEKQGVLGEAKQRMAFVKPSAVRRREAIAAVKRRRRRELKEQMAYERHSLALRRRRTVLLRSVLLGSS